MSALTGSPIGSVADPAAAAWDALAEQPTTPPAEGWDERPECPRCEGQGMFVDVVDGESAYRRCSWCSGTGLAGAA